MAFPVLLLRHGEDGQRQQWDSYHRRRPSNERAHFSALHTRSSLLCQPSPFPVALVSPVVSQVQHGADCTEYDLADYHLALW
jgi:hypothetical protein